MSESKATPQERWCCVVEFEFNVETEPSKPRHAGDAECDFAARAFHEGLRPRLSKAFPGNDGINWMVVDRAKRPEQIENESWGPLRSSHE